MADEREQFTFTGAGDDYGILTTDKMAAKDAAAFLNGEEPVEEIKKNPKKQPAQSVKTPSKKTPTSPKDEDSEEEVENDEEEKTPSRQEILALLSSPDGDEDDEEDDEDEEKEKKEKEPIKGKKEAKNSDEESSTENEEEDSNPFIVMSKELLGLGIFTKDDNEEESAIIAKDGEELSHRFALEKKKGSIEILDTFLSSRGEEYREWFDAVMVKGISPQDYMARYNKIESIQNLDIKNTDDQERIVRENLRTQGYKPDVVENKLQRMIQNGELEEEAGFAQEILLKRERDGIANETAKKEQELALKAQQRNEFVNSVSKLLSDKIKEKEFDGIPVDMKIANSVGHYITAEKYQTPDGKKLTQFDKDILDLNRPENHAQKVKLGLIMQLLRDDPTLSTIQKKAASKNSSKLFAKLERDNKNPASPASTKDASKKKEAQTSWF